MVSGGDSVPHPVHLGYWTNWSYGRLTGSTITLDQNGVLLTAFVAVFVTFVGNRFWSLACFALHQYFSSAKAQDGLYHQRQIILRNSANEMDGLVNLFRMLSAWRRRTDRRFNRLMPLIGFAVLNVAAFHVASIFSSKVSSAMGSEVLVSSASCGIPWERTYDDNKVQTILSPWDARRMTTFNTYAQQCYLNSLTEGCGLYIKK